MRSRPNRAPFALVVLLLLSAAWPAAAQSPTIDDYLTGAFSYELVAAAKADRIAWIAYEAGERNVYTAAAPDFRAVRLTQFSGDNGIDLSNLRISDDGRVVVFVRGHTLNREGWVANPTSDPAGAERAFWAANTSGTGGAWRLGEGTTPVLSPDGRTVIFAKDGQIYHYPVAKPAAGTKPPTTDTPLIKTWGSNSGPVWSPDGSKIAFVSERVDHSYVVIYDVKARAITYVAPGVDRDTSPTWSPDSKRVAFIRRPGTPFGLQSQQGSGGIGNPAGPASQAPGGRGRGAGVPEGQGQAPGGGRAVQARPGLTSAAFPGGYTLSFWIADATTGEGREFWHTAPADTKYTAVRAIQWAGDHVLFQIEPDEWTRFYSVNVDQPQAEPTLLNPGDGLIEFYSVSADGRTLFYGTNEGDIDRRHIWRVPVAGGGAVQLTKGEDIETYPAVLASGSHVAILSAGVRQPQSVGIVPAAGGATKLVSPPPPKAFPAAAHVTPENVVLKAADGLEIHNQLFLPGNVKPGERRPAMVFVHGGPVRQMLLGYHYRFFYHMSYGVNQWLANQGYIVLSVNFRSGIGYGRSFRMAPNTGARGNAEYQDVVAAGQYLLGRPDVDPKRIGIWGLSYGGLLTAQALARNSDIFAAGVDLAGVHLFGSSIDPESVSYQSSAISQIDKWKSPVLLVHGDDDRNVAFAQTVGLVQLLRAHNIEHELIVFPDDVHDPLVHKRWLHVYHRMEEFLGRHLSGARR